MKVLIDCNNIAYGAAHLKTGMSYNGMQTDVIYGFFNQFFAIANEFRGSDFFFCWDSKENLRRKISPIYKNRDHKSDIENGLDYDSVFRQFNQLHSEILPALGFKGRVFKREGYEADDIIAYLSKQFPCIIVSSDEDLYQLLSKNVSMYKPFKKAYYTVSDFWGDYNGISSQLWPAVKAIAGCKGDNVIGIEGVGEKTAVRHLLGKLKMNTAAAQRILMAEINGMIEKNLKLVTLPFGDGWEEFFGEISEKPKFEKTDFYNIFKQYGFVNFIKRLPQIMNCLEIL